MKPIERRPFNEVLRETLVLLRDFERQLEVTDPQRYRAVLVRFEIMREMREKPGND